MPPDYSQEHIVIVLWIPEPTASINEIKRRLPGVKVTYVRIDSKLNPFAAPPSVVPKDIWETTTILITFSLLPKDLEDAPRLKHIHFLTAGVDHVASHAIITSSDIMITTSSGIHTAPIGEWVIMTSLAVAKHLPTTCQWQREHNWSSDKSLLTKGTDWVGKRVGIAGYGSIGRQVARIFVALGAEVIAYTASPRMTPESRKDKGYIISGTGDAEGVFPSSWMSGTSKEEFHKFLRAGLDCLVLTLPLTKSTLGLISTPEFEILRDANPNGCIFVNISRGKMVNQEALLDALNRGWIRGAAIDVTDPEPLPKNDPLWDAKNLIITPHTSPLGQELFSRGFDVAITNLERQARGETMFNILDREKGY